MRRSSHLVECELQFTIVERTFPSIDKAVFGHRGGIIQTPSVGCSTTYHIDHIMLLVGSHEHQRIVVQVDTNLVGTIFAGLEEPFVVP